MRQERAEGAVPHCHTAEHPLTLVLCFVPGKVSRGAGGAAGRSSQEIIDRRVWGTREQDGAIASSPCLIRRAERRRATKGEEGGKKFKAWRETA